MKLKGRHWFVIWLVSVLGVFWFVVWRQSMSFRLARELGDLRERRVALEGRRSDLLRRIRDAESRAKLVPWAKTHLHLRLPADTEIILLPSPPGDSSGGR